MAWAAYFLISCWTICPGVALPTVSWALQHQLLGKKIPRGLYTGWSDWRHFLNYGSLFLDNSSLCQVGKKLPRTCVLAWVCSMGVQETAEAGKGFQLLERAVWANVGVGTEPRSFARAVGFLSCWTISPTSDYFLKCNFRMYISKADRPDFPHKNIPCL